MRTIIPVIDVENISSNKLKEIYVRDKSTTLPDDDPELLGIPLGHQLYSGYYIISKITHKIDSQGYETDVELIKNSFAKRLPGQEEDLITE